MSSTEYEFRTDTGGDKWMFSRCTMPESLLAVAECMPTRAKVLELHEELKKAASRAGYFVVTDIFSSYVEVARDPITLAMEVSVGVKLCPAV